MSFFDQKMSFFEKNVKNRFWIFDVGYADIWSDMCFPAPVAPKLSLKKFESISTPNIEYRPKNLKFPRVKI